MNSTALILFCGFVFAVDAVARRHLCHCGEHLRPAQIAATGELSKYRCHQIAIELGKKTNRAELQRYSAKGGQGIVFQGLFRGRDKNGEPVAIKQVMTHTIRAGQDEREILSELHHKNIVQ